MTRRLGSNTESPKTDRRIVKSKKALRDALENALPGHFKDMSDGIEAKDLDKVLRGINGMLDLNKDYMIRAAARQQ